MTRKKEWYQERWVMVLFIIVGLAVIWNYFGIFDDEEYNYLKESGYEVLKTGSYEFNGEQTAYVDMKSLGNRRDQVMDGLISLASSYPDADKYSVSIIEEKRTCLYVIEGIILNTYLTSLTEEVIINSAKIRETLPYLIWSNYARLEHEKYIKGEESDFYLVSSYQRLMETGIDVSHLSSIINYQIDDPLRCE